MRKSIAVNSIFNIAYKLITAVYPLIAVSYLSHIVGSDKVGAINYAQNIVSWFVIIAALGLPTYGTKEIAKVADDKDKRSQLFCDLFTVNFLSTSIAVLAYVALIFAVPRFANEYVLYAVAGAQIVLSYINVDWFYQGMEEYKYISIRSTVIKLISLIALFIFVRTPDDYIAYVVLHVVAIAGNNVFNIVHARKYICVRGKKPSVWKHVKPVIVLLIASLAIEAYMMIDTLMLGIFHDDTVVGCYSNAMKLTRMVNTLCSAIGAVLLPRLSVTFSSGDKTQFNTLVNTALKVMLLLAIPATVGMVVLSDEIVLLLFGSTFGQSVPVLKVLALMVPVVVFNTMLGMQVLVTADMEWKYILSVGIGAVVNIVSNAIFIPRFGGVAAAWTSLASEVVVLTAYLIFTRKIVRIRIELWYWFSVALPLALYVLAYYFGLSKIPSDAWLAVVINVAVCCVLYFGLGLLLKNEAVWLCAKKAMQFCGKNKSVQENAPNGNETENRVDEE
ncbi:MAG: flippase [Clostridia bacterium]|nr:flippase [Clostridia bacterium]